MRKLSRKGLVKKLDKVVSKYVVKRDQKCVTCGSTEALGCGHLFSRVAYSTRWDLFNCHAQCWNCNYKHEYDPYPYIRWFIAEYGMSVYDALHNQFSTPKKFKDFDLLEMIDDFTQKLEEETQNVVF